MIIDDDCLIGSRCMVVQGARVGQGCVLGAGLILSNTIPVIDAETGEELGRGVVPAVVRGGHRHPAPQRSPAASSACPAPWSSSTCPRATATTRPPSRASSASTAGR